jgi:hypothetical protein
MSRFAHSSLAAAGLIGLAGFAAPAFAGQMIYVDGVATNPGLGVSTHSNVTLSGKIDGITVGPETEYAVQVVLTVNPGTTGNTGTEYTLPTWCVDIFHNIYVPSSGETYSLGSLTTDNSTAANPTLLTSQQITEIGDLVSYGNNQMQTTPSALIAAEVQSAIWYVEYNTSSGNYGANYLNITSNDSSFFQADIDSTIASAEAYGGGAGQLVSLAGVQGLAYEAPAPMIGSGFPAVLALGGMLLGANLWGRSKKRRSLGPVIPHAA